MRTAAVSCWLALVVLAVPSVAAAAPGALRLVFLDADERAPVRQGAYDNAAIDIGRMRARRCGARACTRTTVQRRFRLRIDGRSAARFVRVSAFVQSDVPGQRVKVDGRVLSSVPQVIDAAIPLRVPVVHSLEIEVPATQPEGALSESIVWIVEEAP